MRILLIEDDRALCTALLPALQAAGYTVDTCHDGADGKALLCGGAYDVCVLDRMLPGLDGLSLLRAARAKGCTTPVLMLTALSGINDRVDGLDAGADDYMVKPFDFRELNARIKVLLKRVAGNAQELPQELVYADLRIDLQRKDVERNSISIKLSPKEYNLLLYMVENAERVLSRVEIAEKVWNTHFDTGTNFIDVYINYLRKKIDRDFEPKLIHTKAGMGFILTDKL